MTIIETGNQIINILNQSALNDNDQARVLAQVIAALGDAVSPIQYGDKVDQLMLDHLSHPNLATLLLVEALDLMKFIDKLQTTD